MYAIVFRVRTPTQRDIDSIPARAPLMAFVGTIEYGDGFNGRDSSSFCFGYHPDPRLGWYSCDISSTAEVKKRIQEFQKQR